MPRHIPKSTDREIKAVSGFRCAWCGCYLTERHHIYPYCLTESHDKNNLILLCPNCHSDAHKGRISTNELLERRIRLSGAVDRSSGNLSINSDSLKVKVGGNTFIDCNNILVFNDIPLISTRIENGYLLVSLRLFSREGYLICWMNENRWWIENQAILDFMQSRGRLTILENSSDIILDIVIKDDTIEVSGIAHLLGEDVQLSHDRTVFKNNQRCLSGNTLTNFNNAILIIEQTFAGPVLGNSGIQIKI